MCLRPMKQFREFEKRMCGLCSSSVFLVALFTLLATLVFATPQSSSPAPDAIFIGQFLTLDPGHPRAEEHTSELQSLTNLVCRLLLEKKKNKGTRKITISGVGSNGHDPTGRHGDRFRSWMPPIQRS